MSTAAVSSNSIYQELQTFYQDRKTDLSQLGQALKSGDLASAQTAYTSLTGSGQQLTIDINNGQGSQAEPIAINLNNNANEHIILNLFNSAGSDQSQGNSISVQA